MSKQVFISMLRQGNNGNEILSILDAIVNDNVSTDNDSDSSAIAMPTLTEIDFWCIMGGSQTPPLSIANSAQNPVVAGVFGVGGGRIYNKRVLPKL